MAQTKIRINGKEYSVGCEDGQEAHLAELAALLDRQVCQVSADVGQVGETRLFLMGALLLADELVELKGRIGQLQGELARAQSVQTRLELKAVSALEKAARRIEGLATAEMN